MRMSDMLENLLRDIRACRLCEAHLPLGPRPIIHASATARILVLSQAPGTRVHETGISFSDRSGDRLRQWMGVDRDIFYDESRIAIMPMGMCYPGKGKGGDLPPRPECAAHWHEKVLAQLPQLKTTLLVGQYAVQHYLKKRRQSKLAETVAHWRDYTPEFFPLPHPSPRNLRWFQKHPWFEAEVVPAMRAQVARLLAEA